MSEGTSVLSLLQTFTAKRTMLKERVTRKPVLWIATRGLVSATVLADILLALLTLSSVTARQVAAGLGPLDALPLALYILPLVIILPSLALSYYRHESGLVNLLVLSIAAVLFSVMSSLVKGFLIVIAFNVVSVVIVILMGSFRPRVGLRKLGKASIAWFLILNLIGLMFPASVYLMGEYPIASATPDYEPAVFIEVPLADFDGLHSVVEPNVTIIGTLDSADFGLNLRLLSSDYASLALLSDWIAAVNTTDIPIIVTISTKRASFVVDPCDRIGSTQLFQSMFSVMKDSLDDVVSLIELYGIEKQRCSVRFDLCLSNIEWEALLSRTRSVDLGAFALLVRTSLESVDKAVIEEGISELIETAELANVSCGVRVEGFVLDDAVDGDTQTMMMCGLTFGSLGRMQRIEVSSLRSSYSISMSGDVGEYLVHSYSRSAAMGSGGSTWSMQLGIVGNITTTHGNSTYMLPDLMNDVATAVGNGVGELTVSSLGALFETYGLGILADLRDALESMETQFITYTFRIFAFRSVFMAIDTFDLLLL